MRFGPLEIRIVKAPATTGSPVDSRGGWWPVIREPYAGAWQRDVEWSTDTVLAHHAVFACVTLIASDISKLRPKLVELDADGIWSETASPAFSPVLRKPNDFQNRIQFFEWWMISKLLRGNTYVLKERDSRGVVARLYLLDPSRVTVLVAPNGAVFYQLATDNLAGIPDSEGVTVPASEIIHDRFNCLYHPLVGISPLTACGVAATVGTNIEKNSSSFFGKGSNPSGTLTGPLPIDRPTADRLKEQWETGFSGDNSGKVAVLGSDLKFQPLRMNAVDSQLIEQLHWTAEVVCSAFHVPGFKVGVGQMPTYQNGEVLNGVYYSDCLQAHIEALELVLDEGLGLTTVKDGRQYGVEFDIDGLLRMDSATQVKTLTEGIGGGLYAPNEARKKIDKKPLPGGDTVYLQQQYYSLEALAQRDKDKPFAKPAPAPPPTPGPPPAPAPPADDEEDKQDGILFWKSARIEYQRAA